MTQGLMTLLSQETVIETIYELHRGEYTYRVSVAQTHARIKRTLTTHPMWTHGVLTQGYDAKDGEFKPIIRVEESRVSLEDAEKILAQL